MGKASHYSYEQRFDQALKRTTAWGLPETLFCRLPERFVNEDRCQIFQQVVTDALLPLRAEEVSQQCFTITAALKAPLEHALQILVCPDDLDLNCAVVAVEQVSDQEHVHWQRFGVMCGWIYDTDPEVDWFEGVAPVLFERGEFMNALYSFRKIIGLKLDWYD